MAKQFRWERAWESFAGGFTGKVAPKKGLGGYNQQSAKRERRANEDLFWALVNVLNIFGIIVLKHDDLGTAEDAEHIEFLVGGTWDANKTVVNLRHKNVRILAHEFTHAMDYLKRGWAGRAEGEFIASGGGYLLVAHYTGLYSPSFDIEYAKRQGAGTGILRRLGDYVPELFSEMCELVDSTQRGR